MYRIGVTLDFSSAHFLDGYEGSCEKIHGHNYQVEAVVESPTLDEVGLALDFRRLKAVLGEIVEELDHRLLNELPAFAGRNPSSELLARHIYEQLAPRLPAGARLAEVRVWETAGAWAAWRPD